MLFTHFKTITSFSFYPYFSLHRSGFVTKFLIYIWLLSTVITYVAGSMFVDKHMALLIHSLPPLTFQNGTLKQPQQRIHVQIPGSSWQLVLDSSAKATRPSLPADGAPLVWIHQNNLYFFANGRTQHQTLPEQMSFTTDAHTLQQYQGAFLSSLKLSIGLLAFLFIPLLMLNALMMAFVVGVIFKKLTQSNVPYKTVAKFAVLMLGPLSLLGYIHLWVDVPLYSLAQLFLCIIYMQQIFNVLKEDPL